MDKTLIPEQVANYIDSLVPPRPPELKKMEEEAEKSDFPIIGPACGYLCYQVARMTGARHIFELGSGFGYSTAWFAQAVQENGGGEVHHVVWEQELSQQARIHLTKLGYTEDIIQYHVGEAVETLKGMPGPFDLIFNDIEKEDYPDSLVVIEEKLRPGGVLIVDNLLWGGRIFNSEDQEASTEGIRKVTSLLVHNPDWITTLLPLRDGIMIAFKK